MQFERSKWRLIKTPPSVGAWNMAIDEAILEAIGKGNVLSTLRFYAWKPACLSLGYAQPFSDVNVDTLNANGWDIVRRPTGGRAILHCDELTYSVIGSNQEKRLARDILSSYLILSKAILSALHKLGIPAQAQEIEKRIPQTHSYPKKQSQNPVCFEEPSNYEIVVSGKKLVGSAQARRKEGVLQHGSFPLYGDLTRIIQALKFDNDEQRFLAQKRVLERAMTAEQFLGYEMDWDLAVSAFIEAFQEELNLELISSELSERELMRAEELVQEKYANIEWTQRV